MDHKRILVVSSDDETGDLIQATLALDGHFVVRAGDAFSGISCAQGQIPDLIVIDADLPRLEALTFVRQLRKDKDLHLVPALMLISSGTRQREPVPGMKLCAGGYLCKPFIPRELSNMVTRLLERSAESRSTSPLTGLPGMYSLEAEAAKRIGRGELVAACCFDLNDFKSFNDRYGYRHGDTVLQTVAQIIREGMERVGEHGGFLSHAAGDSFIVLAAPGNIEALCETVIREFDRAIPGFYTEADRQQGYIVTRDRKGIEQRFPIMSISVAVASNEHQEIPHVARLFDIVSEMKAYAKNQTGSVWVKDRRQNVK